MKRAALGMAKDDTGRAGITEHGGRHIAGEGAGGFRVAVLPARQDACADQRGCQAEKQSCRRADQHIDLAPRFGTVTAPDFHTGVERSFQAVHLPVAGYEGLGLGAHGRFFRDACADP